MNSSSAIKYCPCGSAIRYLDCCGAYLQGRAHAKTPESLMRSRYSAYVERNVEYIRKTMRPPALQHFDKKTAAKGKEEWLGLEIISTGFHPDNPHIGFVEFIARYRLNNTNRYIHEHSEFHLIDGRWYYVEGKKIFDS